MGDQPGPAAEDWAQPSVAPAVPSSGGYRVLSAVIFIFLFVLLAGAVAVAIYLGTNVTLALSADSTSVGSLSAGSFSVGSSAAGSSAADALAEPTAITAGLTHG